MLDSSHNNHLILALASFTERIKGCISPLPDTMYEWQPDRNNWSIQMVLAHLHHCEPLFRHRLARIVSIDKPFVMGFGPEEATPYSDKSTYVLVDTLSKSREETLDQIYTYTPEDWERKATHSVLGETTLKEQIQLITHHDTEHLGQLYDLCELWHANHETLR